MGEPMAMRFCLATRRSAKSVLATTLLIQVILGKNAARDYHLLDHLFAIGLPPVPLGIVLGEAVVDIAFARPAFGFVVPGDSLVFQRLLTTDHALGIACHMWPGIRIVLFDGAGGADVVDAGGAHGALHFVRCVLLCEQPG